MSETILEIVQAQRLARQHGRTAPVGHAIQSLPCSEAKAEWQSTADGYGAVAPRTAVPPPAPTPVAQAPSEETIVHSFVEGVIPAIGQAISGELSSALERLRRELVGCVSQELDRLADPQTTAKETQATDDAPMPQPGTEPGPESETPAAERDFELAAQKTETQAIAPPAVGTVSGELTPSGDTEDAVVFPPPLQRPSACRPAARAQTSEPEPNGGVDSPPEVNDDTARLESGSPFDEDLVTPRRDDDRMLSNSVVSSPTTSTSDGSTRGEADALRALVQTLSAQLPELCGEIVKGQSRILAEIAALSARFEASQSTRELPCESTNPAAGSAAPRRAPSKPAVVAPLGDTEDLGAAILLVPSREESASPKE